MAKETAEFRHESLQDCESIVKYLKALTEGFENGRLKLANGNEPMELKPEGLLNLNLKARRKDNRVKLTLKVSWKEEDSSEQAEGRSLVIDSKKEE